jgi:hypothetical protein
LQAISLLHTHHAKCKVINRFPVMTQTFKFFTLSFFAFSSLFLCDVPNAVAQLSPTVLGSWGTGIYRSSDPRSAEILAYDPPSRRLFVVNSVGENVYCLTFATLPRLA